MTLTSCPRSKFRNADLNIRVSPNSAETLNQVSSFKYLGIEVDKHLTFDGHVNKLCGKVKARAGLLWRIRPFISESLAKDLYTSLIHPHFTYGDIVYDACSQQSKVRLQVHQNMALRAVKNVDPRFPTQRLHDQTGVEWLDVERKQRCCIEAYKALNNLSSTNVNNLFTLNISTRTTRSSTCPEFKASNSRTKFGDRNFPNRCEAYWKSLPPDVKTADRLSILKSTLHRSSCFTHEQ